MANTILRLNCRGINDNGKPVLKSNLAEPIIVKVPDEFGFDNKVFCRYLAMAKNDGYLVKRNRCTIEQKTRMLESDLLEHRTCLPMCPYVVEVKAF